MTAETVTVAVVSQNRTPAGQMTIPARLVSGPVRRHLLYEVVKMQTAGRRRGTAATKGRGAVAGSGRKPWRQKRTGRARVGSVRSPLWTGGGTVFGPQPRGYDYQVPKRARRTALRNAVALRWREARLVVVDAFDLPEIKTKTIDGILRGLAVAEGCLLVISEPDERLERSVRNLSYAKVVRLAGLNVYDILRYPYLVVTREALTRLVERLAA